MPDKKTRLIMIGVAALLVVCAAAYFFTRSEATPKVDPAIVQAAAEASRQMQKEAPPPADEPKREGRARPGMLGGPQ